MSSPETGIPPGSVTSILRLEGAVVLFAALAAYQALGGNWWVFALFLMAPDLSMLGMLAGARAGARVYNIAHTYALPALLAANGWALGSDVAIQIAVIWMAHIGLDRAVGYGLKYPQSFHRTHLGVMGKSKSRETEHANAG